MLFLKLTTAQKNVIRGMTLENDIQMFSVYDFINCICNKEKSDNYARKTFFRLISNGSEYKDEIITACRWIKLNGSMGKGTPSMDVSGLMKLLNCIGGKISRAFRNETLTILQRYLDGDESICMEVNENKRFGKAHSYTKFAQSVMDTANDMIISDSLKIPKASYIYGTQSAAFPNLIKIGRTDDINARLIQLNTSCAPAPHRIVALAQTFDSIRDESMVHGYFAEYRREGEFFEISIQDISDFLFTHVDHQYRQELLEYARTIQGH